MDKPKIVLYTLHGAWHTADFFGSNVFGIEEDIDKLLEKLDEIEKSKAADFLPNTEIDVEEERGIRYYEVSNNVGSAQFYISEHYAELSDGMMEALYRVRDKKYRFQDIEQALISEYEAEVISEVQYEYAKDNTEAFERIYDQFQNGDDCNVSFNGMMETAIAVVVKAMEIGDTEIEYLWKKFGNVTIDEDELIEDDFMGFPYGTHIEEVWKWFDNHYSKGVAGLIGAV